MAEPASQNDAESVDANLAPDIQRLVQQSRKEQSGDRAQQPIRPPSGDSDNDEDGPDNNPPPPTPLVSMPPAAGTGARSGQADKSPGNRPEEPADATIGQAGETGSPQEGRPGNMAAPLREQAQPSPGGGAAQGGGGKPIGIRQGIDLAKEQAENIGGVTQAAAGIVEKVEAKVDTTAAWLMTVFYVIFAFLAFLLSAPLLFSTGFLGTIGALFPIVRPKYAYKLMVLVLLFIPGVDVYVKAVDQAVDPNKVRVNGMQGGILGFTAVAVLLIWFITFGTLATTTIYNVCRVATLPGAGTAASVGGYVATGETVDIGPLQNFCTQFNGLVDSNLKNFRSTAQ